MQGAQFGKDRSTKNRALPFFSSFVAESQGGIETSRCGEGCVGPGVCVECASGNWGDVEADARRCWFPCQLELRRRESDQLGFVGGSLCVAQCIYRK